MTIKDYAGLVVRLPEEQWQHICAGHPEMEAMLQELCDTVKEPDRITEDKQDPNSVKLYYKWFADTEVGDKWLRVAVKYSDDNAFVVTAFPTNIVR